MRALKHIEQEWFAAVYFGLKEDDRNQPKFTKMETATKLVLIVEPAFPTKKQNEIGNNQSKHSQNRNRLN